MLISADDGWISLVPSLYEASTAGRTAGRCKMAIATSWILYIFVD